LISVALILEYEAIGKREAQRLKIPESTIEAIVRAFCFMGRETDIHFRLRPFLPDPGDEFLLELAVAGHADAIVTHNVRHFVGVERFGIQVLTPREFLRRIVRRGDMSKSIAVPEDLYQRAAELAARDHVSVEEFVSAVLANRFASRDYIESRAGLFNREEFERALEEIPDVEPDDQDRL